MQSSAPLAERKPHLLGVLLRALLVTFLATLTAFAVSLLCGIVLIVIVRIFRGGELDVTVAYRRIAIPTAALTAAIGLVVTLIVEFRRYRSRLALWRGF